MPLTYHTVTDTESPYVYSVSRSRLEEHLRAVAALVSRCKGRSPVAFDDGHRSSFSKALSLLEEHGIRGIHFITVGWTGRRQDFLDWAQLREMIAAGQEIQSHSWSHSFLTRCGDEDLNTELRRSKETLEDQLGVGVDAISVPGGRYDSRVLAACREAGYRRVFTSDPFLRSKQQYGVEVIGRLMVRRSMRAEEIGRWLIEGYPMLSSIRLRQYGKLALRQMVGDELYHRLWRCLGQAPGRESGGAGEEGMA